MEVQVKRYMDVERVLRFALTVPMGDDPCAPNCIWGLPLYLQGGSGIGKSRRMRGLIESMGFFFPPPIYPSQKTPDAFDGVLTPNGAIVCLVKSIRDVRDRFPKQDSVLFVDELPGAEESVQNALLSVLWERHAGDVQIPPTCRILLAGNPLDAGAGGHALKPPTANRLVHLSFPLPDKASWKKWEPWKPHGGINTEKFTLNWDRWQMHLITVKHEMDDFIDAHERMLYVQPDTANEASEGAWPSPRSWEFVLRILTLHALVGASPDARALKLAGDELDALLEGSVGRDAFSTFRQWERSREQGIPSPESILASGWAFTPTRPDIGRYVIKTVSSRVKASDALRFLELLLSASLAGLDDAVVPALGDLLLWLPLDVMDEPARMKAVELLRQLRSSPLGNTLLPSL